MIDDLKKLKNEGHRLLDEYVSLDITRDKKRAIKYAYEKLGTKLNPNENTHFGMMTSREEIIRAISKLKRMIKKRQDKMEFRGVEEIAPNVMELQKMANGLNKHLIKS
jgi:hypothetical protein